jgi:hypothetical protein
LPRPAERERLDALLLDPGWLKEKLAATASPRRWSPIINSMAGASFRTLSAGRCG